MIIRTTTTSTTASTFRRMDVGWKTYNSLVLCFWEWYWLTLITLLWRQLVCLHRHWMEPISYQVVLWTHPVSSHYLRSRHYCTSNINQYYTMTLFFPIWIFEPILWAYTIVFLSISTLLPIDKWKNLYYPLILLQVGLIITFSHRITNIPILILLRSALNIIFSLKILLLPTWMLSGPRIVFCLDTLV